jgi:hypothetical protein
MKNMMREEREEKREKEKREKNINEKIAHE